MFHENAIEAEVRELINAFESDNASAMAIVLNLFLAASGAAESFSKEIISDYDSIDKNLKKVLGNYDPDVQNGYPLLPKKGRIHLKFKKNLVGFIEKFMSKSRMLEGRKWLLDCLYQWLGAMSSSHFKPFRHSATFIANTIQCSLCEFLSDTIKDLQVAESQLITCKGKESRSLLERKITDLKERKGELEEWTDNFFEGIFIHRCRDSDPIIRADCGIQLCSWMVKIKDKYMDPQYLRYIGWMLADKVAAVRQEYMRGLSIILVDSNVPNLRLFLDRFKSRIIEMATRDVDLNTRLVSIEALVKMNELDLLDSSDFKVIVPMLFEADQKIRGLASIMLPKILDEKQESFNVDEFQSSEALELHCFCTILIESDCSQAQDPFMVDSQVKEDELSLEEEERLRLLEKEQKELLEWYSENWKKSDLSFDRISVTEAVKALWDVLPLVRNWENMGKYLTVSLKDLSYTSPNEELCLLYLFSASVRESMLKIRKLSDDEKLGISKELIRILPILLQKYGSTYSGNSKDLIEILSLVDCIDFQTYVDFRKIPALEELLSEFKYIFCRHSDTDVLMCCAKSLIFIMGDESEERDTKSNTVKKGVIRSQQIQEASRECIEEIFTEVLQNQFLPQFEKLSLEASLDDKIESIINLKKSLCRFDILRCELGLTDCTAYLKGEEDIQFIPMLYSIIDLCLSVLNYSCDMDDSKNHHCSLLIDLAIKVAMKDIFFYCKLSHDLKESVSIYEKTASNTERLIDICEAIITSDESDDMDIKFGLKSACLNNLMTLLLFFNSNISHKFGKQRLISEMVQSNVCQIIERTIFMFGVMEITETSFYKVLVENGLNQAEMKFVIQKGLFNSLVHLVQLVNHSLIDLKLCHFLLAFFGFSNNLLNPMLPYLFGKLWNELTENLLKASMNKKIRLKDATRRVYNEEWCESITEFIFKGLDTSIGLYCSGMIKSVDTIQDQVKLVISQFKAWGKLVVNEKYRDFGHLKESISKDFYKSCKTVILYMKDFQSQNHVSSRRLSMISELSAIDFKDKRIHSCARQSFEEVTAIWKIMGALGGAMKRLFASLNMDLFDFEELYFLFLIARKQSLLEEMKENSLEPKESGKDWQPFWQFLDAIRRGDASIRKTKPSAKNKKGSSDSGKENKSPKEGTSKKSEVESVRRSARSHSKKVMRDESSSDDNNDNNDDDSGEDAFLTEPENVFLNVSTPKNLQISNEQSIEGELMVDDDRFNYLSSIVKRRPTDEFEADDFASSPPALTKRIRY